MTTICMWLTVALAINAANCYSQEEQEAIEEWEATVIESAEYYYRRLQTTYDQILGMKDVTIYDDNDYLQRLELRTKPKPNATRLADRQDSKDTPKNEKGKKYREDVDGGFSRVTFRRWKFKRPGDDKFTRLAVAIKLIEPPKFLKNCTHDLAKITKKLLADEDGELMIQFDKYVSSLEQALNEMTITDMIRPHNMYYCGDIYRVHRSPANDQLYIVMKYLNGKDMCDYVFAPDPSKALVLTPDEAVRNAARLGEMLYKLHRLGIIYRDLKYENMVIDKQHNVFLIDKGLALILGQTDDGFADDPSGTAYTMSPEARNGKPYGYRADVWSYGIIVYLFLTGQRYHRGPFGDHETDDDPSDPDERHRLIPFRVDTETPNFDDHPVWHTWQGKLARQLVERMLSHDYERRPTMKQVLQDDWFRLQGYVFYELFEDPRDANVADKAAPPREDTNEQDVDDPYDGQQAEYLRRRAERERNEYRNRRTSGYGRNSKPSPYVRNQSIAMPTIGETAIRRPANAGDGVSQRPGFEALITLNKCVEDGQRLPSEFDILDPATGELERFVKVASKPSKYAYGKRDDM